MSRKKKPCIVLTIFTIFLVISSALEKHIERKNYISVEAVSNIINIKGKDN